MIYFALGLVVVVLSTVLVWREMRRPGAVVYAPPTEERPEPADHGPAFDRHERMIEALEERIDSLRLAVSEGIQHVDRAENRIKATVARAQKKLEEHGYESPGLDAEALQLRLVDGGGSEESELPPVHPSVEGTPSSIPGVTLEELQRARGL